MDSCEAENQRHKTFFIGVAKNQHYRVT